MEITENLQSMYQKKVHLFFFLGILSVNEHKKVKPVLSFETLNK